MIQTNAWNIWLLPAGPLLPKTRPANQPPAMRDQKNTALAASRKEAGVKGRQKAAGLSDHPRHVPVIVIKKGSAMT